jgi:hypothetical protein
MKPCFWLLFITWELPQAILAAVMMAAYRKKITGSEHYNNSRILYVKGFPGGISLGRIIFLNSRYSGNDISKKHEYGHCRQSLLLGWFYLPVVGLASILRVLVWRIRKLDPKKYYMGYPEDWANWLGFGKKEYLEARKRLKQY